MPVLCHPLEFPSRISLMPDYLKLGQMNRLTENKVSLCIVVDICILFYSNYQSYHSTGTLNWLERRGA